MRIFILIVVLIILNSPTKADQPVRLYQHQALTGTDTYFMDPDWSPNGRTILLTSKNYRGLFILDMRTRVVEKVSDAPAAGYWKSWSPNGDRIITIFSRFESKRRQNSLQVIDPIKRTVDEILPFGSGVPDHFGWIDNISIYYINDLKINMVNMDDSEIKRPKDRQIDKIVYHKGEHIYKHFLDNKEKIKVGSASGEKLNLRVSPNGDRIVYEILGGHLWTSKLDGSELVDIGIGYQPDWSPKGDKIAYIISTDDGHDYTGSDIFMVNADGSKRVKITDTDDIIEMNPDWSPDGDHIVYNTYRDGIIYFISIK